MTEEKTYTFNGPDRPADLRRVHHNGTSIAKQLTPRQLRKAHNHPVRVRFTGQGKVEVILTGS